MSDLQMTNQDLSQRQSMEELANQLTLADHLVYKKYLPELQNYPLVEPSEEMKETLDVKTCIKLFQMKELTLKRRGYAPKTLHCLSFQHGPWLQSGCDDRCSGR